MSLNKEKVLLAGATGNLGGKILKELVKMGVPVLAPVRKETPKDKISKLKLAGAEVLYTDFQDAKTLGLSLRGVSTVISALSGLYDVIIERQAVLLDAAVIAGVEKFIPSDFSIDFTKFPEGQNRNLDLRRKFHILLDNAPISSTSIFNGAFMEMLEGQMPLILYKIRKVLYFGDPDQKMDFTSIENVAQFTARAALDPKTPKYLRISGDELSAREIAKVSTKISGKKFGLFYGGSLKMLSIFIKILKTLNPAKNKLYPAWQGMQYMKNMFEGKCKLEPLDNSRYPDIKWKKVEDVLREKFRK